MPAFSFKERFVPFVKDGSKRQTIRHFRRYPVAVGSLLYLYYGMRTKFCERLREPEKCTASVTIFIDDDARVGIISDVNWLSKEDEAAILAGGHKYVTANYNVDWMNADQKDDIAFNDGFRRETAPSKREGCMAIMYVWWLQQNGLPFVGNLIRW